MPSKTLTLYKDKRADRVRVISNTQFNVEVTGNSDSINYQIVDDPTLKNQFYVEFSVPYSIDHNLSEIPVRILSRETGESESIIIRY